jgi:Flp pilus assembly protein TadD
MALDSLAFSPPSFVRTPLQSFLEQLYAEGADGLAVMWSYSDFHGAHSGLDTHAGVEFIGYQMLKMGDVHAALDLLKQNVADYPKAATAAFGLGRAHKTAGDTENARAEFRRALELDPQNKAARQALEAIKRSSA